jgi:hypothetical protein
LLPSLFLYLLLLRPFSILFIFSLLPSLFLYLLLLRPLSILFTFLLLSFSPSYTFNQKPSTPVLYDCLTTSLYLPYMFYINVC